MKLEPIDAEFLALSVRAAEHGLAKVASELGLEKQALDVPSVTSSMGGVRPEARTGATYGGIGGAALGAIASALIHRAIAKRKGTKSNLLVDGALGGLAGGALGMGAGYLAGNKGHFFTPQKDLGVDVIEGNTKTPVPLTVIDELAKAEANKSIWNQKNSLPSQAADVSQSVLNHGATGAATGTVGGFYGGRWGGKGGNLGANWWLNRKGTDSQSLMTAAKPGVGNLDAPEGSGLNAWKGDSVNKALGGYGTWFANQQKVPGLRLAAEDAQTQVDRAERVVNTTPQMISKPSNTPGAMPTQVHNTKAIESANTAFDKAIQTRLKAQAAHNEMKDSVYDPGAIPQRFRDEIMARVKQKGMDPNQMTEEINALLARGESQARKLRFGTGIGGRVVGGAAGAGLGYALPQVIARLIGGGRVSDNPTMSDPQN